MDPDRLRRLAERAPVPFRALEPLAPMTSFRSGGPAALYAEPEDAAGLAAALAYAEGEGLPALILGGGTNLIFDDLGFEGLVARPGGRFRELAPPAGAGGAGGPSAGAPSVWAGAAARLSDVVGYARSQGRSGWARLAGVPGTLGGALVMNAGAHGVETGDLVVAAQVLEGGRPACVPRGECGFAYRRSALEVRGPVLGAELLLGDPAPEEEILRLEREALGARAARLPRRPSAGSVFRNPPGDSAGRLIEACGLKGARFGGAEISREHANVIVNAGGASSSEFRALAGLARLEVMRREGVLLEPEVRMLGRLGEVCP
jgi:UDP-N-acetylmuramate dehydrogenase